MTAGKSKAHYQASMKALAAAELSFKTGIHATAAAKTLGSSRSAATYARLILEFGSDQDIDDARTGKTGLRTLADKIRPTLTAEIRKELKKRTGGKFSEGHLHNLKTEKDLWVKLKVVLENLSELPHPKEMIPVVKSNNMRARAIRLHLHNATKWIEDFNNEWKRSEEDTSNTGGSNEAA